MVTVPASETEMLVAPEFLRQLLLLPDCVEIVGAAEDTSQGCLLLALRLRGPANVLPSSPNVTAVYEARRRADFVRFDER